NLLGQRHLHQDAMDIGIVVQRAHPREYFGFAGVLWERVVERTQTQFLGNLAFVTDIDLTRRIVSNQHRGEPGHQIVLGLQPRSLRSDPGAEVFRERFAVDDLRRHLASPNWASRESALAGISNILLRLALPPARAMLDLVTPSVSASSAISAAFALPSS